MILSHSWVHLFSPGGLTDAECILLPVLFSFLSGSFPFSHTLSLHLPHLQECVCPFPLLSSFGSLAAVFCFAACSALRCLLLCVPGLGSCVLSPPPFPLCLSLFCLLVVCSLACFLPVLFLLLFPRCWLWLAVLVPSFPSLDCACVCVNPQAKPVILVRILVQRDRNALDFDVRQQCPTFLVHIILALKFPRLLNFAVMQCDRKKKQAHISDFCIYHKSLCVCVEPPTKSKPTTTLTHSAGTCSTLAYCT